MNAATIVLSAAATGDDANIALYVVLVIVAIVLVVFFGIRKPKGQDADDKSAAGKHAVDAADDDKTETVDASADETEDGDDQ